MAVVQRLFGLAKDLRQKANSNDEDLDIAHHIRAAYALLCDANKRAIQVPPDVVTIVTQARGYIKAGELPPELEQRFWNAYGLLSSSIQPAETARQFYKRVFYITLAALLIGQLFYLGVESVRARLSDLEKEVAKAAASVSAAGTTSAPANVVPQRSIASLRDEQKAYFSLGRDLLSTADAVSFPLHVIGMKTIFAPPATSSDSDNLIVRGKIEMLALFLAGYLLPMLYGLLGACAFVLRKLSDEIDKLTYANDTRVRYSLRLNIGLLSGLAVGWFIKPTTADATLVTLSPVALAFIAGYASELFFVFLDKIVQAFGGTNGSVTTNIREVTTGAITTTSIRHRETHVAGATIDTEKKSADQEDQHKATDGRENPSLSREAMRRS
jgi:hypothetical protein